MTGLLEHYSAVLPDYLTERSLTQEQLPHGAGAARQAFQKFEKGKSVSGTPENPSLRHIMAIAEVLDASLGDLVPEPWPDLRTGRVGGLT